MKISVLIAHYLYEHHSLELPGIGVFRVNNPTETDAGHAQKEEVQPDISFEPKKIKQISTALLEFIRAETGKILPLAEADVVTFIEDGRSMLNLGKPFHLDGIGTLTQMLDGSLQFSVGTPITEKLEQPEEKGRTAKPAAGNEAPPFEIPVKPILYGILGILSLVLIWWLVDLGIKNAKSSGTKEALTEQAAQPLVDTAALRRDSIARAIAKEKEGKYKFIMEETNRKTRALRRFAQVNELSPRIEMETSDSLNYTIFVVLPATDQDTTRIKDSLNAWYYGTLPNKIRVTAP